MKFKRAVNVQKGARDMVKVAEERVMAAEDKLDPTWQEMLNKANIKVTITLCFSLLIARYELVFSRFFSELPIAVCCHYDAVANLVSIQ